MKITTDFSQLTSAVAEIRLRFGAQVFSEIDDLEVTQSDKASFSLEGGVAKITAPSLSEMYCAL